MRAIAWVVLAGCASSSDPQVARAPESPPAAIAADAAPPASEPPTTTPVVDAAASPPPVELALASLIVAPASDTERVTSALAVVQAQLGACLGEAGATTTELMFALVDDRPSLRSAWQNGAPLSPPPACLSSLMPTHTAPPGAKVADVYVVVSAGPAGATTPPVPPPPERKKSFDDMFCQLEKLAGAETLEVPKKQETMIAWARANVRHPAPFQIAGQVGTWALQDRDLKLKRAIQAEGIKKCPLQRW